MQFILLSDICNAKIIVKFSIQRFKQIERQLHLNFYYLFTLFTIVRITHTHAHTHRSVIF